MFTNVKPTVRHISPENLGERSLMKVVYVVLEPQYQSALSAAVKSINANNPHIAVEVSGYLIEELRSSDNYEAFKKDVSEANVFVRSEEHTSELQSPVPISYAVFCLKKKKKKKKHT